MKNKIISVVGALLLILFFIGYHALKNEEKAQLRERAHQAHKEYIAENAKWEELLRKNDQMQASIKESTEKVLNMKISTPETKPVSGQLAQEKDGHYYAENQRKINDLPRDFGQGIVYVNCTFDDQRNTIIFHYMLSFDLKGNVSQEQYEALIQQMKRTPDWDEAVSMDFSDIQVHWNMPSGLEKFSLLHEKWL